MKIKEDCCFNKSFQFKTLTQGLLSLCIVLSTNRQNFEKYLHISSKLSIDFNRTNNNKDEAFL